MASFSPLFYAWIAKYLTGLPPTLWVNDTVIQY
jgi:hypothetical protein